MILILSVAIGYTIVDFDFFVGSISCCFSIIFCNISELMIAYVKFFFYNYCKKGQTNILKFITI